MRTNDDRIEWGCAGCGLSELIGLHCHRRIMHRSTCPSDSSQHQSRQVDNLLYRLDSTTHLSPFVCRLAYLFFLLFPSTCTNSCQVISGFMEICRLQFASDCKSTLFFIYLRSIHRHIVQSANRNRLYVYSPTICTTLPVTISSWVV